MDTENSTSNKIDKYYRIIRSCFFIILAFTYIDKEFATLTILNALISLSIFALITFHKWKIISGTVPKKMNDESETDHNNRCIIYEKYKKIMFIVKRFFLLIGFSTLLIGIGLNEFNQYFPKWHQNYVIDHCTREDYIKEFKPVVIPMDSLIRKIELNENINPFLLIKHNKTIIIYDYTGINCDLAKHCRDVFNGIALFCNLFTLIFTVIFILLDMLGKVSFHID